MVPQHVIAITYGRAALQSISINIDGAIDQGRKVFTSIDGCSCAVLSIGDLGKGGHDIENGWICAHATSGQLAGKKKKKTSRMVGITSYTR